MRFAISGGVSIIGCGLLLVGLTSHHPSILPAEMGLALTGLGMGLATGPLMGLPLELSRRPELEQPRPSSTWPG